MTELENENRKMREPLEAAKKEMEELRRRAENYEKDKALLAVTNVFAPRFLDFSLRSFLRSEYKTSTEDLRSRSENGQMGIRSSPSTFRNRSFELSFV